MVPSFLTAEQNPGKGDWRVVRRDFIAIEGQPILSRQKFTALPPTYRDQAAAERAAGRLAEVDRIIHIPYRKGIITVILLGEKKDAFVPILLQANGEIFLEGDGLASPLAAAMGKAAQIAREKGFLSFPPTGLRGL